MKPKRLLLILGIILLGAVVLSPAVGYLGLDPMPGDIAIDRGNLHFTVPVVYSLCASVGLALFYWVMKR